MMESTFPSRGDAVDDRDLIARSLPERADLAPWLSRASAMYPLAFCLGFLPAFLLVPVSQLDEAGARFGLRCLHETFGVDLLASSAVVDESAIPRRSLSVWFTSTLMASTGIGGYGILLVFPVLSVAVTTFLIWKFVAQVFDARRALLTCVLFVSTPFFMAQTLLPNSSCLGLACMIAALWGCLDHFQRSTGFVSRNLLLGGLAWGASFLAGGAAAWMVLVMAGLLTDDRTYAWISGEPGGATSSSSRRRQLGSLGIWIGVGLATCILGLLWLGGAGDVTAVSQSTPAVAAEAAAVLAATDEAPPPVTPSVRVRRLLVHVWREMGWLSGFAICGFIRLFRKRSMAESAAWQRRGRAVCLVWISLGIAIWLAFYAGRNVDFHNSVSKCWLVAGFVFLAAGELDALLKRQQGWWSIAGIWAIAMTLMSLTFNPTEPQRGVIYLGISGEIIWWISLLIVFVVFCVLLIDSKRFERERWVTCLMLLWPLVAQYAQVVPFDDPRDPELRRLQTFCRDLTTVPDETGCVFISQVTPPIRLQYMIASYRPQVQWEILREGETLNTFMATRFPTLGSSLIIHWGETENMLRLLRSEGLDFEPVASPQFFARRELHALSIHMKTLEQAGLDAWQQYGTSPHLPHGGNRP